MAKRLSTGGVMRKKLSDITNNPPSCTPHPPDEDFQDPRPEEQEENLPKCHDDCIVQQLLKERVTLMQVIAQRNKVIDLAGTEVQKLKLQNWHLAQTNTQILTELNLGRDRIKALQHEVACKAALLKTKDLQPQGTMKTYDHGPDLQIKKAEEKVVQLQSLPKAINDETASNENRSNTRKSQSLGPVTFNMDVNKEKIENRRRSLRRQSAKFTPNKKESSEDLFELEDVRLQVTQLDNPVEEGLVRSIATEDQTKNTAAGVLRNEVPRVSFGRPLRKSVEKIQSYKQPSLRYKMRRVV